MRIKGHQIKVPILFLVNLVLVFFVSSVNAVESRKLDDTPVPATNGTEEKCGSCGTVYPSPPPPAIPPPSPPPPKKTPTQYCPPPPPSSFIYITGPPGNLYPVDEDFSAAAYHRQSFAAASLPLFVGMLFTLAFW
ncbi:formin-like protein 5 [Vigna radiata var. radiata]|uniref:Formin-like protein 5 n=1 Tax=Vigna radiata var. radiata TaxID=3916 RepID=A0A1S3UNT4_VIGRR|nr:formin-like protein 5 [Vigna radiata var. radiata]